jgi:hypothetical protein
VLDGAAVLALLTLATWVIAEFDPETGLTDTNASFAARAPRL